MHDTQTIDKIAASLLDLMGFLASPQRDDILLREANVTLDRALFPLLVRLGMADALSVGDLADQVGRDHTTVSRQLAKLQVLGLISRRSLGIDRRVKAAALTAKGGDVVLAITQARRRLLSNALSAWTPNDRSQLAELNRRFVVALERIALDRLP